MHEDFQNLIINYIKPKISKDDFKDWFSQMFVSYDNGYILNFPNDFVLEWVKNNYSNLIKDIEAQFNIDLKTKITLKNKNNQATEQNFNSQFNSDFTFDTFIVANSNIMAHEAAKRIANDCNVSFNPLFIYGNVGLGKTHLMHAIAHERQKSFPKQKILYLSSEQFMNSFINALRTKTMNSFKEEFRSVDLLLIDDFQFLGKKEATQEEFFHTFNALLEQKKQLVISADQPPHTLPGVDSRMKSRLGWGLIVDIHPATYELKVSILQAKSEKLNLNIESEVLGLIAQKISTSIRELEGAFLRVTKYAEWMKKPITSDLVHTILNNIYENKTKTQEEIISIICNHTKISFDQIKGTSRQRNIVRARQKTIYLLRKHTGVSYIQIAKLLGGKDHTSIIYAENKAKELINSDIDFAQDIHNLENSIQ